MELFEPQSLWRINLKWFSWWPQMAKLMCATWGYFWESLFFKQAAPRSQCKALRCKSKDIWICDISQFVPRAYARGVGVNPPPPWAWYFTKGLIFTKIRGVRVEEYAYYVNKLRMKTRIWRQTVKSQKAHTKYKWPPYATEWNPPWIFSAYAAGLCRSNILSKIYVQFSWLKECDVTQEANTVIAAHVEMLINNFNERFHDLKTTEFPSWLT